MDQLSEAEFLALDDTEKKSYLKLMKDFQDFQKYNQNKFFKPYDYQKLFYDKGKDVTVRALIAANRCGKTYSAAMELSYHLTGIYPDWWEGRRWDRPIRAVAAGVSSVQVRRVLQNELVGTENRDLITEIGTGSVPRSKIDVSKSSKVRDGGFGDIAVEHVSGGHSIVSLFSYSQGMEPMQGFTADFVWVDEQDKNNFDVIFSELVKRTASVKGSVIATFTPLQGLTHVVNQFWDPTGDFHDGLVNAGWDDVEHLDEDVKKSMVAATPPHLRDAVTRGIPVLGSGAVFSIGEDKIMYDDIEIDPQWPKICGIDVGFTNDPTAAVFVAKDPSTGIMYIYDEYGDVDNNVFNASQHVGYLHAKNCSEIPIIYDSAAAAKVGASGKAVIEVWQEMGLNVLDESFKNPHWLVDQQNTGSYKAKAAGLVRMFELMVTGKLKVHRQCQNWWREFRKYSYDEKGVPSDKDDHWMDASRYAVMSAEKGLMQVPGIDWYSEEYLDDYHFQSY